MEGTHAVPVKNFIVLFVYVVQLAVITALTGGGEYMLAVFGIILDYVIVAAVTAIVTLIFG